MDVTPVPRRSLADDVLDQLAAQILDGQLGAGEALPPERALTEHFQVNRQAVREGLQRLAQLGLIEIRHGDATRVADHRRRAGLDLLVRLVRPPGGPVDPAVFRSTMELRAALGPDIAAHAADRAGSQQADELAEATDHLVTVAQEDGELNALRAADQEFWEALVDSAGNVAERLAFNSVRRACEAAVDEFADVVRAELADTSGHRAIRDAVRAGDRAAAEDAAWALLARGLQALPA